jgi:hypothetical protein
LSSVIESVHSEDVSWGIVPCRADVDDVGFAKIVEIDRGRGLRIGVGGGSSGRWST